MSLIQVNKMKLEISCTSGLLGLFIKTEVVLQALLLVHCSRTLSAMAGATSVILEHNSNVSTLGCLEGAWVPEDLVGQSLLA